MPLNTRRGTEKLIQAARERRNNRKVSEYFFYYDPNSPVERFFSLLREHPKFAYSLLVLITINSCGLGCYAAAFITNLAK